MNVPRLKRLIVFCVFGVISLFPFSLVHSQSLSLASGSPDSYVVKEGDTLWDIASIFLEEIFCVLLPQQTDLASSWKEETVRL